MSDSASPVPAEDPDATIEMSEDSLRDMALGALRSSGAPRVKPGGWHPPSVEELQAMLPGYEVQKFLARGGMGAVYRGLQTGLSRVVAIKILPPELQESDPHFAERFKQEARAMAHLNHPGIVAVYDSGEMSDGTLFFVMEFIEGTDVAQMVAAGGRLPSDHAMAIAAHVCDALQYAHEHGVVHRDIKPANIMVGYDGRVKVADFGLAKINQAEASGLTQSGMVMGTLHFMAPEALTLGSAIDHRADIYAVGVMLYQMLTGKLPQGMFEMPSLKVPGLDPRYDGIVANAMREDRDLRYQQIHDMRLALDGIVTEPVAKLDVDAEPAAALPTFARPQRSPHQPFRPPQPQLVVKYEQRSNAWLWATLMLAILAVGWLVLTENIKSSRVIRLEAQAEPAKASGLSELTPLLVTSKVTPSSFLPSVATKEQPYVNTLGMKFVPVPGTDVLMCIHETRTDDYAVFATEAEDVAAWWQTPGAGREVRPGDHHPVVCINPKGAISFCRWLSEREQLQYRVPTDREWSVAVGLGNLEQPDARFDVLEKLNLDLFPWGKEWPPPAGVENLADATTWTKYRGAQVGVESAITGYEDGFASTAPVMSFKPNGLGIFDLGGNIQELVSIGGGYLRRGGAWKTCLPNKIRSSYRIGAPDVSERASSEHGFRCVLVLREPITKNSAVAKPPVPANNGLAMSASTSSSLKPSVTQSRLASDFSTIKDGFRVVNLLAMIDADEDAIEGVWRKTSGGLLVESGIGPCLLFPPYEAPDEYDFKIEFSSLVDEIGNVTQTCVQNDRKVYWVMQSKSTVAHADASYGFRVDERPMEKAEAKTRLPLLRKGERHESIVEVRKDSIRAWLDGKILVTWSKPLTTPAPDYPKRQLGVGTWDAGVMFHRIEVIERNSMPSNIPAIAMPPVMAPSRVTDLLPLVDLKRDADLGSWSKVGKSLRVETKTVPAGAETRTLLPYAVQTDEYDFEMEFSLLTDTPDSNVYQRFPAGGKTLAWAAQLFKAAAEPYFGFPELDGLEAARATEAFTRKPMHFSAGKRYRSLVRVRKAALSASINDEEIVSWQGDLTRFAMSHGRLLRDPRFLEIGFGEGGAIIHKATLTEYMLPKGSVLWTDVKGRSISAEYKSVQGDKVILEIRGKELAVALSGLSDASRALVASYQKARAEPPHAAVGIKIAKSIYSKPATRATAVTIDRLDVSGTGHSTGAILQMICTLRNGSGQDFEIPKDESTGSYPLAIRQSWVERLGRNPEMPLPAAARDGKRYAQGGGVFDHPQGRHVFLSGESFEIDLRLDTKGFAPGKYRYWVELREPRTNKAYSNMKVDFELLP